MAPISAADVVLPGVADNEQSPPRSDLAPAYFSTARGRVGAAVVSTSAGVLLGSLLAPKVLPDALGLGRPATSLIGAALMLALLCVPGAFGRLARACALMPVAAYDHMNQASALLGRWLRARFGFSVAVLTFARAARAGLRRLPGARAAPQRPRAPPAPPLPGAATDRCRADRPRSVAVCRLQRRGERLGKRAILSSRRR